MRLLFLLLFAVSTADAQLLPRHCPQGCDCLPDSVVSSQFSLTCRWESLVPSTSFSSFPPNLTRSLTISCSTAAPIVDVSSSLLKDFESLHSLQLQRCPLKALPHGFFRHSPNLRWLSLQETASPTTSFTLSAELLSAVSSLERLSITSGRLASLPPQLFCLLPHLQVFNVSHNELSSLSTASKCRSVVMIADISHNRLGTLREDDLESLPAVRQLFLAHNKIASVENEALLKTPLLQQLDLSENAVEELPQLPETLVHANLASNRLRKLSASLVTLKELVSLNLSNNLIQDLQETLDSHKLEVLDLSSNRVTEWSSSLLRSPSSLQHLSLEKNSLTSLPEEAFSNFSSLHTLLLASNGLSTLAAGVLRGLTSLSILSLRNNSISVVEEDALAEAPLSKLDLSSNSLSELPAAIHKLFQLDSLNLSSNAIERTPTFVLNKLPHLRHVDLSWNRLQAVEDHVFTDCSRLAALDLSHNEIRLLETSCFAKCPQLHRLDLSSNRIVAYNESLRAASGLKKLRLADNRVELLEWEALPPRLEVLHLHNNRIALLGEALHSRIREANLSGNRLEHISASQLPSSLEVLDLRGNRISLLEKDLLSSKAFLQSLDLRENALTSVSAESLRVRDAVHPLSVFLAGNPLGCHCEMHWIRHLDEKSKILVADRLLASCVHPMDGRRVSLETADARDFLCPYQQMCDPQCICCAYDKCDCKSRCPPGCSCFRDATTTVNVVRCSNLTEEQRRNFSPRQVPMYATDVYLSGLSLPVLKTNDFFGRPKLVRLYLNSTGIRDIQLRAFNSLPQLELLDLSNNELRSLRGEELHKVDRLSHLFLNGNRLKTFETSLTRKLPALRLVSLNSNLFEDVAEGFDTPSLQSLSLAGNPFRCDCTRERFTAPFWLVDNEARVVDASRVECRENVTRALLFNDSTILSTFPPNLDDDVFAMPMLDFFREANRSICVASPSGIFGSEPHNSLLILALGLALLFLLIIAIVAISVAKKTHSAMQQRRYKASSSLNGSSTTPGSSPLPASTLLSYHAFVSYAKKDEKFVVESLCRRLEDDDYQLCLLHRDGPSYSSVLHVISDELNQQIEASQCLVIVLTRHFLEHEWKTVQVRSSHQLFAKNRGKRVIALLDKGVDPNRLDTELGTILRKNTVIKTDDALFWTMLRAALPAASSPTPSSQIYSDCYGIVPSALV